MLVFTEKKEKSQRLCMKGENCSTYYIYSHCCPSPLRPEHYSFTLSLFQQAFSPFFFFVCFPIQALLSHPYAFTKTLLLHYIRQFRISVQALLVLFFVDAGYIFYLSFFKVLENVCNPWTVLSYIIMLYLQHTILHSSSSIHCHYRKKVLCNSV